MKQVLFSQRDPAWAQMPLGLSDVTVGKYGCLLTCAASLLATWDVPIDPERLNAWLMATGGYANGNLFVWRVIHPFGVRLVDMLRVPYDEGEQAAMSKVAQPEKYGAILLVDFAPKSGMQPHYVRLLPVTGSAWPIADPWQLPGQERIDLRHYLRGKKPEQAVLQIAIYENRVGMQSVEEHASDWAAAGAQEQLYECQEHRKESDNA